MPVDSSPGPFAMSLLAAVFSSGLLMAVLGGMPINMTTTLAVMVPVMTMAVMLIAISMAWMFILAGRHHRRARWLGGSVAMIAVTMLELFALTVMAGQAPPGH